MNKMLSGRAAYAFVLILSAGVASADTTVFGPTVYTLTAGKPQVFEQSFTADTCGGLATFTMVADQSEARPLSSASVEVNGGAILQEKDFKQRAIHFERPVALGASNTIRVTLKGGPRDATLRVSIRRDPSSPCGPVVAFTSPAAGATVASPSIATSGTVVGSADSGVVVNGVNAELDLAHAGTAADPFRWFALVDAVPGPLTLTAVGSDGTGASGTPVTRNVVAVAAPPQAVQVRAFPAGGVVPLDVAFTVATTNERPISTWQADLDGDGVFEKTFASGEQLTFTYVTPAVRQVTVRAIDDQGAVSTGSASVVTNALAPVDALIRASWGRFREALAASDVDTALAELDPSVRPKYGPRFELIFANLPRYAAGIATIQPVSIRGDVAHYLLTRDEEGTLKGYHVYFVRDSGGVWRIAQL